MIETNKNTCPFCKGAGVLSGRPDTFTPEEVKGIMEAVRKAVISTAVKAALESMGLPQEQPPAVPDAPDLVDFFIMTPQDLLGCKRVKTLGEAASMFRVLERNGSTPYKILQLAEFDEKIIITVQFACTDDKEKGLNFFGAQLERYKV